MGGIRFCGRGCKSEDSFVCFVAKPTQRTGARDLPRDWKWTREGRSQRRQKLTISRREQRRTVDRREQSKEDHSRDESRTERRPINRSQKAAARTCWPTDAALTHANRWVNIPSGFVGVSREYTPAIACKCPGNSTKGSQTSPSCARS